MSHGSPRERRKRVAIASTPASALGLDDLTRVWNLAFSEYFVPVRYTPEQLAMHIETGSVDLDRSLVWTDAGRPVGVSLLGVRGRRGWIGGFAIVPAHRGRGLSRVLFGEHVALARRSGLTRLQLEVITANWARRVYEGAGFVVARRVSILEGALATNVDAPGAAAAPAAELLGHLPRLRGADAPAWQREPESLRPVVDWMTGIQVGDPRAPRGVALVQEGGDAIRVADAAAADDMAAARVADALAARYRRRVLLVINEPPTSAVHRALTTRGMVEMRAQYEMVWSAR